MIDSHLFNVTEISNGMASGLEWRFGFSPVISAVTAVAAFVIGVKILRIMFPNDREPFRESRKAHSWKHTTTFQGAHYCSICKRLMLAGEGRYCDCCGIYSDMSCTGIANQTEPCKAIAMNPHELMKHHWVKGNLPQCSVCDVCDKNCFSNGLRGFKCCWCQRTVHSSCKPHTSELCDFGRYRLLIVPPTSVEVITKRNSMRKYLVLKSVKPTNWVGWSPLIVIANCKSGNKNGEEILSMFRGLLHPGQVIDLSVKKPEAALEWCILLGDVQCKILVAGGDGTIGWVLNSIEKAKLNVVPAVGILPLGTGNDLSRILGWGKGTSANIQPSSVLDDIIDCETVLFDRWKVEIKPKRSLRIHSAYKELFMYNYLSIGVDAQVTLDFHRARESPFYIFSSRLFNKLLYLSYGTQQMIEKKCQGLNEKIELYLDGERKELPAIESVVILNIDSWGAGVHLWEMSETEDNKLDQSYNDGKLEVLALYSSLHIAQLQVGLGVPYRIGQASHVRVKLNSSIAVQADGEPWFQQPAEFNIIHYNQALMLNKSYKINRVNDHFLLF